MWMQLGNRAFVAGASQRRRDVREGKTDASVKSLVPRQVPPTETSKRNLPGMDTFRLQDHRAIMLTIGDKKNETSKQPTECVYLCNPTMDDLMRLVHSVKTTNTRKQVIIMPQTPAGQAVAAAKQPAQTEEEIQAAMLLKAQQRAAEMASRLEFERIDMERLAIGRALLQHMQLPECHCHKTSHHLRVVPKPTLHEAFCVEEEKQRKHVASSGCGTQHAFSVGQIYKMAKRLRQPPNHVLIHVSSDSALSTKLCNMESKLLQQMSVFKTHYDPKCSDVAKKEQKQEEQQQQQQQQQQNKDVPKLQSPIEGLDLDTWLKISTSVARAKQMVDAAVQDKQKAVALEQTAAATMPEPEPMQHSLFNPYMLNFVHFLYVLYYLFS